tara:strand:- start:94 stop:510 length:417 start_codon:yes stop_codon:yes gene_type:complete
MAKKKKIKKLLKGLGIGAALLGAGKALMNARDRKAMLNSATADDGFGFMKLKDFGPYSSKVMNAAKNKVRRGSILADPRINKMDLSEVDLDYTSPDMSRFKNMDMGLGDYMPMKKGGRARKTKKGGRAVRKANRSKKK